MGAIDPGNYQPCMYAEKVMTDKAISPEKLEEGIAHFLRLEIEARERNKDMAADSYRHLAERLMYKLKCMKGAL